MQYLTQNEFKRMLLLSYEKIEAEKEQINKINVFPVPDQDTGTNIAKSLEGIKEAILSKDYENLGELEEDIAEAVMVSAQGNSGIIYAGFLLGFLGAVGEGNLDSQKLALGFEGGAQKARLSIAEPKEGTMLDVIDASNEVFKAHSGEADLLPIFQEAITKAKEATLATQEKMPLLAKANVVDAGSLAFLYILESYYDALMGKQGQWQQKTDTASQEVRRFIQTLSEKYELVVLLEDVKMGIEEIRSKLKDLGSSIDIIQSDSKLKIHIHTNDPKEVKKEFAKIGNIYSLREEDIVKEIAGEESVVKTSVGLVTDILSDLSQKVIERYGVEIVNLKMDWSLEKQTEGDNIYQKMRNAKNMTAANSPKTSQPSPKEYADAFQKQLQKFEKVLYISFTSKLSGSYNSSVQGRDMLEPELKERVFLFDTLQVTCGEGLIILRALELIQSQFAISEIISELNKLVPNVHLYGAIEDSKWLEMGGRLSSTQAQLVRRMQAIGVWLLLTIKDGVIVRHGFKFGCKKPSEALYKEIKSATQNARNAKKKVRVIITHCDNEDEAKALKAKLKELSVEVSYINSVYPIIGVHIGPGSVVAAWMELE